MPPALSDAESESGSETEIPYRGNGKAAGSKKSQEPAPVEEVEDEDEEGEEEGSDPEEYVVETIISHRFDAKGEIKYEVKWLGYEKKSDRTWEGEDNLENARELLEQYWQDIGGKPEPNAAGSSKKRKGRKSGVDSESATPTVPTKKLKKEQEWKPPPGSWENDVDLVETVEEQKNPKTGKLERYAYLVWNNDKKTQHPLHHVYHKCPQKMLAYYESHLVFTPTAEAANGEDVKDEVDI